MNRYYAQRLSAQRLRRVYELAPLRVRRYLAAEIDFVRSNLPATGRVLDLGCGYGRVIAELLRPGIEVVGVDNAFASLLEGHRELAGHNGWHLALMDAGRLALADGVFDRVLCIQNGLSAFKVDPVLLIQEAIRVTRTGGLILFSTYAQRFWDHRMNWFQIQADHGLLGEIDPQRTGNGKIVCRDGFQATTHTPEDFRFLMDRVGRPCRIEEVDGSSLFCLVTVA